MPDMPLFPPVDILDLTVYMTHDRHGRLFDDPILTERISGRKSEMLYLAEDLFERGGFSIEDARKAALKIQSALGSEFTNALLPDKAEKLVECKELLKTAFNHILLRPPEGKEEADVVQLRRTFLGFDRLLQVKEIDNALMPDMQGFVILMTRAMHDIAATQEYQEQHFSVRDLRRQWEKTVHKIGQKPPRDLGIN